jgi:ABC-2 type transport system ATP-binding protein
MERFIDDCLILDYGKILLQMPVNELLKTFRKYSFQVEKMAGWDGMDVYSPEITRQKAEVYSFSDSKTITAQLAQKGFVFSDFKETSLTLEDAFIGLTGKY